MVCCIWAMAMCTSWGTLMGGRGVTLVCMTLLCMLGRATKAAAKGPGARAGVMPFPAPGTLDSFGLPREQVGVGVGSKQAELAWEGGF
jgi:hypothetical protein